MVMATPFLKALRSALEGELWAIGKSRAMHLYNGLGFFDRFIPYDNRTLSSFLDNVATIRDLKFERGVVLPHSFRSALVLFLGGVPERVGYDLNSRGFMLNHRITRGQVLEPTVEHYLRILDALGIERLTDSPELSVAEDEEQRFDQTYTDIGTGYVAFIAGAQYGPSKRWPARHFSQLADLIVSKYDRMVYILPGRDELEIASQVREGSSHKERVQVREMDIGDLKVCLSRASLVVTNDTGPRHISAALGRPTIVILGPMDSLYTEYPSQSTHPVMKDVTCKPCNRKKCDGDHVCMTDLRPEDVFAKVEEIFGG
jgi:heptosyltransferase II